MSASEVMTPGTPINLELTLANTEYSLTLPAGCKFASGSVFNSGRTARVAFRYAFVTGKVATPTSPWLTGLAGDFFHTPEKFCAAGLTVYFASASAGAIVEVETWS